MRLSDTQLSGQLLEAGIASQRIEPGIDFGRDQFEAAILKGLCQPFVAVVRISQGELDRRQLEWRDITLLGENVEFRKNPQSLIAPARRGKRPGQSAPHPGVRGRQLDATRSEEHTSELQSLRHLVCRLLLEK